MEIVGRIPAVSQLLEKRLRAAEPHDLGAKLLAELVEKIGRSVNQLDWLTRLDWLTQKAPGRLKESLNLAEKVLNRHQFWLVRRPRNPV